MHWTRERPLGCLSLLVLICSPALFRMVQVLSVNVPVTAWWIRVSVFIVVALPIASLVVSVIGFRRDRANLLSLVMMFLSALTIAFLVATGLMFDFL
jgi:uncharacterized membrane protein